MPRNTYMSPDEYLAFERVAETRHAYWSGQVVDMSGATYLHNRIVRRIRNALEAVFMKTTCEVFQSDMRVRTRTFDYTYPDLVLVCPPVELSDEQPEALLNPALIVEVLSKSTEAVDRDQKLAAYRRMPSLQEYWVVSTREWSITRYYRDGSGWGLNPVVGTRAILQSDVFGLQIPLADVYDGLI